MKKLENKVVFITGGLSGIGKACAIAAANEGANIVIGDIKPDSSNKTMEEIKKINSKAMFLECDVSSFEQVRASIQIIIDVYGKLDVALNNAGIGGEAVKIGDMTETIWKKVIGINLDGVFNCMKHELNLMAKQKNGVIVNMSSILGKVGIHSSSHYVAAKHGVIGLTQSAAVEYALEGIRVNAICPGFISTPLLTHSGIVPNSPIMQHLIEKHPMNRFGESEEIAKGFIFLASNDSSFVTGTTLDIDGGYLSV